MAKHGRHTRGYKTSFLSPTLPRMYPGQAKQGQQAHLGPTTTTAIPPPRNRHQTQPARPQHPNPIRPNNLHWTAHQSLPTIRPTTERTHNGPSENASVTTTSDRSAQRASKGTDNSSRSATLGANTYSATRSRPVTRKHSYITSTASSVFSPAADTSLASYEATTTPHSAQPKQTNSTKTTSAVTRVPPPTNNGRTQWNATYRQFSRTSPQRYTDRTSCARTLGPMHSHTGLDYTTPFHTPSSRTHQPE